jgi:hypothetical protein
MANALSPSFPDIWAAKQQTEFFKQNVAMKITKFSQGLEGKKYGDVLNRTYSSMSTVPDVYVRGTAMTVQDLTDTNESLTINKEYGQLFYIDEHDDLQNMYSAALEYGTKSAEYLSNQIDADVLGEALNAASTVTVGTLSTTNVIQTLAGVNQALAKKNIQSKDRYGVISPEFENQLVRYLEGKYTVKGDQVGMNGYIMSYMGFDFYSSNQLTGTAVLALSVQPTANDTVTIDGQVFTFVAAIGTTAGNVLIGANVDATRASLATLINTPQTTTANGVALTGDTLKRFRARTTAVNDNTADTLTVTSKGVGVLVVAEGLTDVSGVWTAASQLQHNLFGVKGNPYLVVQRMPKVTEKSVPDKQGNNYINTVLYAQKTFRDNSFAMVDVTIRSDAFTA